MLRGGANLAAASGPVVDVIGLSGPRGREGTAGPHQWAHISSAEREIQRPIDERGDVALIPPIRKLILFTAPLDKTSCDFALSSMFAEESNSLLKVVPRPDIWNRFQISQAGRAGPADG